MLIISPLPTKRILSVVVPLFYDCRIFINVVVEVLVKILIIIIGLFIQSCSSLLD